MIISKKEFSTEFKQVGIQTTVAIITAPFFTPVQLCHKIWSPAPDFELLITADDRIDL